MAAAKTGAALADLSARGTLRITGEDRVPFLHGMCTQDIKGLCAGSLTYAALLTAKGAMVADARVMRLEGALLLDLEPGLASKVSDFLNKYLISEDAEVHDESAAWGRLALWGPRARAVLEAVGVEPPAPGQFAALELQGHTLLLAESALTLRPPGFDLWVPVGALDAVYSRLRDAVGFAVKPLGFEALELLRVEAGVPRYGQDMGDTTFPMEANLERALHFNKGCYIGQEVIARATFRGHMNRKLVGLRLGSTHPSPLSELRVGERKVGFITSAVRSPGSGKCLGLGYVHRDFLAPGTELSIAGETGFATVERLPFPD